MADLQELNPSCPICLNLHKPAWTLQDFEPTRYEDDNLMHWFSPKGVVESAEKGCRGCQLITRIFFYNLSDPAVETGCLTISRPAMNVMVEMIHALEGESYEDSSSEIPCWSDCRELLTTVGPGPKVENITSTGRSQETITLGATINGFSLRQFNIALCLPEER